MNAIGLDKCSLVQMDSFYKPLTYFHKNSPFFSEEESKNVSKYNFDHPNALDFKLISECLQELLSWKDTDIPVYDFKTNSRYWK